LGKEFIVNRIINLEGIGEIKMTKNYRVKRLAISVRPFSGVRVNVPGDVSFSSAEKFVFEKKSWIKKSLDKFQGTENHYPVFNGNSEYTTRDHKLNIVPHGRNTMKLIIKNNSIYVFYPSFADIKDKRIQKAIRKAIIEAWRIEAKKYLPGRVEKLASELSQLPVLKSSRNLKSLQSKLLREIEYSLVRIKAEIHTRLVFGAGCIPMILIGIGLGIIKKGGHLLSAFGASCVPAAILIVCIISGENLIKNPGSQSITGVALMWAGLLFLLLLVVVIYRKLLKN